jgi:hypothetical protein
MIGLQVMSNFFLTPFSVAGLHLNRFFKQFFANTPIHLALLMTLFLCLMPVLLVWAGLKIWEHLVHFWTNLRFSQNFLLLHRIVKNGRTMNIKEKCSKGSKARSKLPAQQNPAAVVWVKRRGRCEEEPLAVNKRQQQQRREDSPPIHPPPPTTIRILHYGEYVNGLTRGGSGNERKTWLFF